jgi:hypothetical protein
VASYPSISQPFQTAQRGPSDWSAPIKLKPGAGASVLTLLGASGATREKNVEVGGR